jgi:F-type H+-transporting ATPase subunit b
VDIEWSTFLLEAANFAILVWLLQHFLYRPVLGIIRRRRQAIEEQSAQASRLRAEADALLESGRRSAQDWEQERDARMERLAADLERERERRLAALEAELEQARQKARAVEARRLDDLRRDLEHKALEQGARFSASLLESLAGPELEQRLAVLFLDELSHLSPEQIRTIRATVPEGEDLGARVVSAFPVEAGQRERVTAALRAILGREAPVRFEERRDLVAGLQVHLGYWVLGANLRDELKSFAEIARHD